MKYHYIIKTKFVKNNRILIEILKRSIFDYFANIKLSGIHKNQ